MYNYVHTYIYTYIVYMHIRIAIFYVGISTNTKLS